MPRSDAVRHIPSFKSRTRVESTPIATEPTHQAPSGNAEQSHWSSDQLLAGRNEIEITHGDCTYRLRLTSLGKLILTK